MEYEKNRISKGGRPAKAEQERATIKLNCWVSPQENNQLLTEYNRVKAGKKLVFAQFLKQILLTKKQISKPGSEELLLTIIIKLQEQIRQLDALNALVEDQNGGQICQQIDQKIGETLAGIQEATTQITTWLYES